MKKTTRKMWYVLLMVVVIAGMLLFIPGSLFANGNENGGGQNGQNEQNGGGQNGQNEQNGGEENGGGHTLTVTVYKAIDGTGFGTFTFQLWRADGQNAPSLKSTNTISASGGTCTLTWNDNSNNDASMYVVESGNGGATSTLWGFSNPASTAGTQTNTFTWDRDDNMSKDVYFKNVKTGTSPTFTVTFDKNGGTVDAVPAAIAGIASGTTVTLPTPPTWSGYTFTGWNMAADGSGGSFTASTAVTANITVYAQWTEGQTRTGRVNVTKVVDNVTDDPTLFSIEITAEKDGSIASGSISETGGAAVFDLIPGKYSLSEVNLPAGYVLNGIAGNVPDGVSGNPSYEFIVEAGAVIDFVITNIGPGGPGPSITVAAITEPPVVVEEEPAPVETVQVAAIQELPRTGNNMLFYVIGFALMAVGVAFGSIFIPKALRKRN
jgi:uncharacterized repeat protein (TIGR02543 family)